MDIEAWWLLTIPLFFALGWLARAAEAKKQIEQTKTLPKSYFKGLNHLLNEEPDQAIDALIDVARVDTGTIDLYFALGNLFTQRGEIERSIRVYQSLLERADLPQSARGMALNKLGAAFLNGGLYDRAESTYKTLLEENDPKLKEQAQSQLLYIYQSQQEWQQAIDVASGMSVTPDQVMAVSHFHCELAEEAISRGDFLVAERELSAALRLRPESVRAHILKGRWYVAQNRVEEGLAVWMTLSEQQPNVAALIAPDVMQAYEKLGRPQEGLAYLHQQLMQTGSVDVLNLWLAAYEKYGQPELLSQELHRVFETHPSLNALDKLLTQRIKYDPAPENNEDALVQQLIKKQVQQLSKYQCAHCGFEASRYYWQCPACTRWESYPPKRIEELNKRERSRMQM